MSNLKTLLDDFTNKSHKEVDLDAAFKEIAEEILFGGIFVVKSKGEEVKRIRIVDVEAYYYSEDDASGYRDYIMYHRNHKDKPDIEISYLPTGTFFPHLSGIDLTFENEYNKYRASMLLRSYKILKPGEKSYGGTIIYPTHLYDDMFSAFNPFCSDSTVEWKEEASDKGTTVVALRKNVSEYDTQNENKKEPNRKSAEGDKLCTENKKYVQDTKPWRFFIESVRKDLKIDDKYIVKK